VDEASVTRDWLVSEIMPALAVVELFVSPRHRPDLAPVFCACISDK
jgi:hypothetical protein